MCLPENLEGAWCVEIFLRATRRTSRLGVRTAVDRAVVRSSGQVSSHQSKHAARFARATVETRLSRRLAAHRSRPVPGALDRRRARQRGLQDPLLLRLARSTMHSDRSSNLVR